MFAADAGTDFPEIKTEDDTDIDEEAGSMLALEHSHAAAIAEKRKPSYTCVMCEKQFSHKGNLDVHMRTHTGQRPFPCSRSLHSKLTRFMHSSSLHRRIFSIMFGGGANPLYRVLGRGPKSEAQSAENGDAAVWERTAIPSLPVQTSGGSAVSSPSGVRGRHPDAEVILHFRGACNLLGAKFWGEAYPSWSPL